MEEKDIKGLLKQSFEHFEADPGADLWPAIEAEIHSRRKPAWWMYAAVAASVAILFFSLFWLLDQPSDNRNQAPLVTNDSTPGVSIPQPFMTEDSPEKQLPPDSEKGVQKTNLGAPEKKSLQPRKKDSSKELPTPSQKQIDENFAALNIETLNNPGLSPLTQTSIHAPDLPKAETPIKTYTQPAVRQEYVSSRNTIDLNDLKVEDAVSFASNTLEKWKNSPIDVYQEKGPDGETKTYQIDFFNLRITKKTHKRVVKQL
ncbi:MAG: hypothetical protein SF052_01980 [Bacteroidia bacterium]|nr:hypothetical protein [Bacteroidia bacterium]